MKRRIYFCGLARNCEKTVGLELAHLLELQRTSKDFDISILVAENDSRDETRLTIVDQLSPTSGSRLNHCEFFDEIDAEYPLRVHRLAFLRETLKNIARGHDSRQLIEGPQSIYIAIDLDGDFARSISLEGLERAIRYLEEQRIDACFPVSHPVYYDVYALRVEDLVEFDSILEVERRVTPMGRLLAEYWFVCRTQRLLRPSRVVQPLEVESAFGGYGIYRMDAVARASYLAGARVRCEHVTLNRQVGQKRIYPGLQVLAPTEHIRLATSSFWTIAMRTSQSVIDTFFRFGSQVARWAVRKVKAFLITREKSVRKFLGGRVC